MKNPSWLVSLLVGIVIGFAVDRMSGGGRQVPGTAAPPVPTPSPARQVEDPRARYRVPVEDTPLRGSADALVTIVVASDFQCPYCKRIDQTLRAVSEPSPGKVRISWRHMPLPMHDKALPAAVVAEEARAQGGDAKFWAMHDELFALGALDRPSLERASEKLGLDVVAVRSALDAGRHVDRIERDGALLRRLGVRSTPTLFVNGRKVVGALPLDRLAPIVAEELAAAEAMVASGTALGGVYAKIQEKGVDSPVLVPQDSLTPPEKREPAAPAPVVLPGGRDADPVPR